MAIKPLPSGIVVSFTADEWAGYWETKQGRPSAADCARDLNFQHNPSLRFLMKRWQRGSASVKQILNAGFGRALPFLERSKNAPDVATHNGLGASGTVLRTLPERLEPKSAKVQPGIPSSHIKLTYGKHIYALRTCEDAENTAKPKRKAKKSRKPEKETSPVIDFLPVLIECQALLKQQNPRKTWKALASKQLQIIDHLKKAHIRRKPEAVREINCLLKWFASSKHDRADFLRNGSQDSRKPRGQVAFGIATLLGAQHYEEYLGFAQEEDTEGLIAEKAQERIHSEDEKAAREREIAKLKAELEKR